MTAQVARIHNAVPVGGSRFGPTPRNAERDKQAYELAQLTTGNKNLARRLEKELHRQRELDAELEAAISKIKTLTFGDWYMAYGAMEVSEIPEGVSKDHVWTWIDGPRFNGDVDVIIPGTLPDLKIKLFITDRPHNGARIKVSCY